MYSYINGVLSGIFSDYIVVENNGIGFQIHVPFNPEVKIPSLYDDIKVFTYLNVTENGITLYGFFSEDDKSMFQKIITVGGIGPKGALAILSTLTYKDIIFAVLNGDEKSISKSPGIGPKTAKRMILELKDKLDVSEDDLLNIPDSIIDTVPKTGPIPDAIAALTTLGYPYNDSTRAVKSVTDAETLEVEELLSLALKEL